MYLGSFSSSYLIKVCNDLVEEAQALQAVPVFTALSVKLLELRHRGEHHAHAVIGLAVQVLKHRVLIVKLQQSMELLN